MAEQAWNPGKLLQTSGAYWQSATLQAGVKLGVFTALGEAARSAAELAAELGLDAEALERLLNALAAMGLLVKTAGGFHNTPAAARWLSREADDYLGFMILHHHHLADSWNRIDEAVRAGAPVRTRAAAADDDGTTREAFLMGMFANARGTAPQVADVVDLSGCRRLLDLGGGPGTYAIYFCLKNPALHATVFDLPASEPFAARTIARFDLTDRIAFHGGDYLHDPIPRGYDAVWLSHVLHAQSPDECRALVAAAAAALEPGGRMLIHDFFLAPDQTAPLFPALFSINMLLGTPAGRSYTEDEVGQMMTAAGIRDVERLPFTGPTESGILAGVKR